MDSERIDDRLGERDSPHAGIGLRWPKRAAINNLTVNSHGPTQKVHAV